MSTPAPQDHSKLFEHIRPVIPGAANGRQVGGAHYQAPNGVAAPYQHWDFVIATQLEYLPAQITRYLARFERKGGLADIDKAAHYAQKLQEAAEFGWMPEASRWMRNVRREFALIFLQLHGMSTTAGDPVCAVAARAFVEAATWNLDSLSTLRDTIDQLRAEWLAAEPGRGYVKQG